MIPRAEACETAGSLVHALIGCAWGTRIATADDMAVCHRSAVQIFVIHNGPSVLDVKVCPVHRSRLLTETDPHEVVVDG